MESKATKNWFTLSKITTEQFAIIESNFSDKGKTAIKTNIRFGIDPGNLQIACLAAFTFESDEKPFIIIEAGCHFQIMETTWKHLADTKTGSLIVPKDFITHLATITVGTTRGVLHAKTENTKFTEFVLPPVNITKIIKKDAVFNLNLNEDIKSKKKR